MRLLLDTHVAIWALNNPELISVHGRNLIGDSDNEIYVSVASVWEITIKHTLGRVGAPKFSGSEAVRHFGDAGYRLLDITAAHAVGVGMLPMLHDDPFDRLLVAQAFSEPMRLLTHDRNVAAYGNGIIGV